MDVTVKSIKTTLKRTLRSAVMAVIQSHNIGQASLLRENDLYFLGYVDHCYIVSESEARSYDSGRKSHLHVIINKIYV